MNINRITNETLVKLTSEEIGALGLLNNGVMTYMGYPKARKQGWKTVKVDESQINYVGAKQRVEFIKIQQTLERPDYAMRIFDLEKESYWTFVEPLAGLGFLK